MRAVASKAHCVREPNARSPATEHTDMSAHPRPDARACSSCKPQPCHTCPRTQIIVHARACICPHAPWKVRCHEASPNAHRRTQKTPPHTPHQSHGPYTLLLLTCIFALPDRRRARSAVRYEPLPHLFRMAMHINRQLCVCALALALLGGRAHPSLIGRVPSSGSDADLLWLIPMPVQVILSD